MKTAAVEIHNLSYSYPDGPRALESVCLTVNEFDFASVIGPNAGGKSTLLKLILGLYTPNTGIIKVFGTTPARARRHIGYMPQQATMDPHFPVNVIEVVLMGRLNTGRPLGTYRKSDRKIAVTCLEQVGLAQLQKKPFSSLSGGQRQRVLLARALACEPKLLLLDEPDAGLDLKVENDFHSLLRELNKNMTIILVSHDLGFVSKFVRTVICVNQTVDVHPTSEVDGRRISEVYGGEVRMIRHDHSDMIPHDHRNLDAGQE